MTEKPANRIYRGIAEKSDGTNARVLVMDGGAGPTERDRATVLYQLTPKEPFWWGYGGSSPGRTAAAILEDVLPEELSLPEMSRALRSELTVAFLQDFLAHCHDPQDFWIPARTVVRWIHGFVREQAQS